MSPANRRLPTIPPHPGYRPAAITHEQVPIWVPGDILCASDDLGWKGVAQRTYRYRGQDVEIPPHVCFMIVRYESGQTPMDRQFDGRWTRTVCAPGHFSLLSSVADSHWHWTENLEVSHVYLDDELLARTAGEMQGREVEQVELHDVLAGSDPVVGWLADQLKQEAQAPGPGGPLYAQSLSLQLAVHLLRHYAVCRFREPLHDRRLGSKELARLYDYIDAHLSAPLSLEDLARVLGVGPWTLNRQLRATLGCSAYRLVVDRRIQRARELVLTSALPLKEIAVTTGFSDQAHLTRTMRARIGVTPGQLRTNGGMPTAGRWTAGVPASGVPASGVLTGAVPATAANPRTFP